MLGWAALASLLASGCVTYGNEIPTAGLDALEIGASSRRRVVGVLGPARGEGSFVLHPLDQPREILFYELARARGQETELELMLVFLDSRVYDGHLWFASSERYRREGGLFSPIGSRGSFPSMGLLESRFVRGRTPVREIIGTLGAPHGRGAARLPPDHERADVLFYQKVDAGDTRNEGGEIVVDYDQRILLVVVVDGVFEGFMGYAHRTSNAAAPWR